MPSGSQSVVPKPSGPKPFLSPTTTGPQVSTSSSSSDPKAAAKTAPKPMPPPSPKKKIDDEDLDGSVLSDTEHDDPEAKEDWLRHPRKRSQTCGREER